MKPQVLLQYYKMADNLRKIIEESFRMIGYEQVKPEQWTVIKPFVSGVDVFVVLQTGFGKRLIYATLPLMYDNLKNWKKCIVVVVLFFVLTPQPRRFIFH